MVRTTPPRQPEPKASFRVFQSKQYGLEEQLCCQNGYGRRWTVLTLLRDRNVPLVLCENYIIWLLVRLYSESVRDPKGV